MEENQSQAARSQTFLASSIIVAALIVGGALVYTRGAPAGGGGTLAEAGNASSPITPESGKNIPTADDDVVLGEPSAPVTFIEWGDYQCPFCGRMFQDVEPRLRDEYIKVGKVKMVYRDFAFLGPESQTAALASQCAAEQGKFWLYHDELFKTEIADGQENSGNLTPDLMKSLAEKLTLDRPKFDACLDSKKYQDEIKKDYEDGIAAGVNGTPGNFVNGKSYPGALPYATVKKIIDEALAGAAK